MTIDVTAVDDPATGKPAISGAAQVGGTLTAAQGTVADPDGVPVASTFTWQWIQVTVNVTSAPDPPGAPVEPDGLTAEAGDGRVRLVWTAPSDDGGRSITRYEYRHAAGASVPTSTVWIRAVGDMNTRTTLISGLANGTAHAFELRAVNSLGGGAAATATATTAAVCNAPVLGNRRDVWSRTMTVGRHIGSGGQTEAGFRTVGRNFGSLSSDAAFVIGDHTSRIEGLYTIVRFDGERRRLTVNVLRELPAAVKAELRLHYCSETSDISSFTYDTPNSEYRLHNVNLDWSLYSTREVALSLPANNAATGAPEIGGDINGNPHVGRPLTAVQGTLADADGLPSTLDYEWFRVDSGNVTTKIAGAAAATYTPAAGDLDHSIQVKVSFWDDLGNREMRDGEPTATVEQPTLTITDASATEGAAVEFTVSLSPASDRQVTVAWTARTSGSDDIAKANDLSGATSGTVTFAANETSKTFTVGTAADEIYEADDTFTVTLSSPSNAVLDPDDTATGTINNDEALPTVTMVLAHSSIRESDDPNQTGRQDRTTLSATLDIAVEGDVRVRLPANSGVAYPDVFVLQVNPGEKSSRSVTVTAEDNNIDAPDRVIDLEFGTPFVFNAGYPLSDTDLADVSATLTIVDDDDTPTVTLAIAPSPMREEDDTGTSVADDVAVVTATLNHPSSAETTVTISAAAVSPAVTGDFTLSQNATLTIPAEQTSSTGTVTITAVDNDFDAPHKQLTVSGSAVNARTDAGGPHIVQPQSLPHEIRDDEETPKVELVLGTASIGENGGSTTVKAQIPHRSSQPTVVTITAAPGQFTASGTMTIAAGQTESPTVTLTAVNNETDAPDKTFTVNATATNSQGVVNPDGVELTITDDDPAPVVTLVLTPTSIDEDDGTTMTTVTVTLDRPSSEDTTITVSAAAVAPAVAGDFTLSQNRTLTVDAGSKTSTGTVTIRAVDNEVDAPDKQVTVSGAAQNTQGIDQPAEETLTVEDEDPAPEVTLLLSKTATDEDDVSPVTVSATLDRPSSADTTIMVLVEAVSPAVAEDFTLTGSTLTISAGQTTSTGSVEIAPVNNETDAPDKEVTVSGTAVNARTDTEQDPQVVQPPELTLTIEDDDPAPVARLVLTPASIDENGGTTTMTTVTAELDRPSSEDTTITVSAAAVSPAVDGDFTLSQNQTLTIDAGTKTSTGTVTIDAVDNRTDAPDKEVTVSATADNSQGVRRSLTASSGTTTNVALNDAELAVTDDDPAPTVTLVLAETSIRESDDTGQTGDEHATTVTATLNHPSSEQTTVTVQSSAGDYTLSGSGRLTIPAGAEVSSGSVTLTAVDNNTDAPDKERTVLATAVNTQGIEQPDGVALTITDDEPPPVVTLVLGAANDTIVENDRSTTVTATLSHPSSEPTTVTVSAAPVSPALAADFTISGTVLTIPAGAVRSSSTATIASHDNDTDAPDKEVTVSATAANPKVPAPSLDAQPDDVTLTIADDEPPPTVTLHLSQNSVGENGGEAAVTATLNHPSSETTVVTVSTAPVSPAAAADFAQTGDTLTITAGLTASTGSVTIAANDNDVDTANKRLTVSAAAANPKQPTPSLAGNPSNLTLSIEDDDARGIAFTPAAMAMREGFTGGPSDAPYKVALASQPTATVTVTVAGAGGLTVAAGSSPQTTDFAASTTLTFTTSNWSTAQTVSVRSVGDSNATDNSVSIRHTASGGDYGSVRRNLSVTVLDVHKSGAELVLTVNSSEIPESGGTTVVTVTATLGGSAASTTQYTVALRVDAGTASTGDFTATSTSFQIGSVHSYNETFRTSATVGITPTDDGLDEDDETVTVTATVTPMDPNGTPATVVPTTVTITDDDTRGVTVTPVQLELDEGGDRTYTVGLDSQPTGAVTVTPSKTGDGDITFQPASLTFDGTNWQTAQTVTVSAAEDGDPLDDQAAISHAVSGADYGAVRAARVQATARDNDGRSVVVSPRDVVVQEGETGNYTVKLNTRPTATVTVRPVATGDPDVTVLPASLSFTTSNWDTEQTVTVSAATDPGPSDDQAAISHRVSGGDYGSSNVPGPEVRVRVNDSGHTVTTGTISVPLTTLREGLGGDVRVTATLDGVRATDTRVTVLVRGGTAAATDFRATPSAFTLVIPEGETAASRTVALFANRDRSVEGDETILVQGTAQGLTFTQAELTIRDGSDMRGMVVSKRNFQVTEQGRTDSYTVKLGSQPTGAVTVTAEVVGDDELRVEPPSLSFTAANWDRTQTMTVQALADPDGDRESATITLKASGADYQDLPDGDVEIRVTVNDDDRAATKVTLSLSPDRVNEDGGAQTITVTAALDGATRAEETDVQVTVVPSQADQSDFQPVTPFTVTIPVGRTSATATFMFTPVDDEVAELLNNEVVLVKGAVPDNVLRVEHATLSLLDDDSRGVKVSAAAVQFDEGGNSSYTLVLNTLPEGSDVTVALSVSGDRDVTVSPARLTFTETNWNTAQTVTVSGAADDDGAADVASVTYRVSGSDYDDFNVSILPTPVTVRDTDTRGVTVSETAVQLREGGQVTYTVVLDTRPVGTVTVRPSLAAGSDSDVSVSPSALSFTTSNWSTPKTVTVSARQDIDTDADNASITHAVSGGDYGEAGVTARAVSVMVTDDDIPSTEIVLQLSTTIVRESATRTQITVTGELNAAPRADATTVILDLAGVTDGAEEGVDFAAIAPVTLTIRAGQTSGTARVTVTPVRDDIDEGESETLQLVARTDSGLPLRPESPFELTLEDDDEAGIVLSRTTLTVREEGSQTWTVKLNSEPTGPVTVTLAAEGTDAQDLTIEPDQLTFATDNWNRTQTVTVSAAEDADGDDDTATIGHTATGGGYDSVEADLPVRVDDIDPASRSVQLSLAPDLVEENGGAVTITVTAALDGAARSAETAVAVQATGGTAQAGTDFTALGTVTVTIPAGETSGTQTFSFSPVDDSIDEGLSETVVLGGTFQGLTVRTATLTLADNDGRGIELPTGTVTLARKAPRPTRCRWRPSRRGRGR